MIEKVTQFLIRNAIIASEEIEVYQYGLELLIKKLLHACIILLIGFLCGEFFGIFVFLIAYASIREYAGGYHAKTELGCYCCTGTATVCTIFLLHVFHQISIEWIFLLLLICGTAIWIFSPQEAVNRPLEDYEKKVYREKAHVYLVLEGILCLSGFFCISILYGIVCAWIIQAVMIWVGWMSKTDR